MKKFFIFTLIITSIFSTACTKKTDNNNLTTTDMETAVETTMQIQPQTGDTIALMKTNMGEIKILLYFNTYKTWITEFKIL